MKNLDLLLPGKAGATNWWTWATVTQVSPLRIRIDGETDPLDATPDCIAPASQLVVGMRVWAQVNGRRVVVHGPSGGILGAGPKGDTGDPGPKGDKGDPGAQGIPGVGVPPGGTLNQILTKAAGGDYVTQWTTPAVAPIGKLKATAFTAANVTFQQIPMNSDGGRGCAYTSSCIVIPTAGSYQVNAQLRMNAPTSPNTVSRLIGAVVVGAGGAPGPGAPTRWEAESSTQNTNGRPTVNIAFIGDFAANDYLSLVVYQNSGQSLAVSTATNDTFLQATLL